MSSNFPNGFAAGVTIRGLPLLQTHSGEIFWVNSSTTAVAKGAIGGSDGGDGSYRRPFATLDFAVGKCLANRGDIIVLMPNHAETLAAAVALDVAGIAVIGLGQGTNRPTFTGGVAADLFAVSADNVTISNLFFNEKTTAATTNSTIDIAAANCTVQNCHFDVGANETLGLTVTAAGEIVWFEGNEFVVTANGPTNFIQLEGVVDQPTFIDNLFVGSDGTNPLDDVGAISFESQACTNPVFKGNRVMGNGKAVNLLVSHGSVVGVYSDDPYTVTGEMDTDDSAAVYNAAGGAVMMTITPTGPIYDVTLDLDNNKASTGLLIVYTTSTVQFIIERKIDGTQWRVTDHWPSTGSNTGLAVADIGNDLDAADDGVGKRFNLGNIGADEEVRIMFETDTEQGDTEIPFALTFRGSEPVLTIVAAV